MSNPCPMGIVDFLMEILTKTNERTSPCPKGPGPIRRRRRRRRSQTFSLNRPRDQKDFPRSDTRVESRAIDLSRARRRTHGTPRTTRHATRTRDACSHSRSFSQLGASAPLRFATPTSDKKLETQRGGNKNRKSKTASEKH